MTIATPSTVETVRSAARALVRRLGFLGDDLAESGLPASAVHAMIEIGAAQRQARRLTAKDLCGLLSLEKSSVSRMLRKLVEAGLLQEQPDDEDARAKQISLTPSGAAKLAQIDAFARIQVETALARLTPTQGVTVTQGLQLYAEALSPEPDNPLSSSSPFPLAEIANGYRPGLIGRCSDMHARYYARTVGFGREFEAIVATGLSEFCTRIEHPDNEIWTAIADEKIVGTIAIDGEDLNRHASPSHIPGEVTGHAPRIAHLRWFIVDDGQRGSGLGRCLLSAALAFVDARDFAETHLWTFRGLDAARALYEAHGFVLADETPGRQWGSEVMEQKFVRGKQTAVGAGGGGRTRTAEAEGF
ncbi:transcriptional regulator, MarR family with acetyltransferase activity [Rhizobium sp. PDO1-076]|nr:transcriptional regulator, MarR family with acetyltransferase activity [Rhizobium sp. PDO1-076]